MGEGDRVWVAGRQGAQSVYHTDPECPRLEYAEVVRELSADRVAERRECKRCSGVETRCHPDYSIYLAAVAWSDDGEDARD